MAFDLNFNNKWITDQISLAPASTPRLKAKGHSTKMPVELLPIVFPAKATLNLKAL